ncbi:hypothetical protein Zmor_013939 [Zophobas morio]|uniref:Uncharacterized protein n=1 Tax=Zophobas morio TaxID=2755281 RepID=A0AA38MFV1_9CUCU|nr:hypothetical protein Zmor_013939 [Zophobas morio]
MATLYSLPGPEIDWLCIVVEDGNHEYSWHHSTGYSCYVTTANKFQCTVVVTSGSLPYIDYRCSSRKPSWSRGYGSRCSYPIEPPKDYIYDDCRQDDLKMRAALQNTNLAKATEELRRALQEKL